MSTANEKPVAIVWVQGERVEGGEIPLDRDRQVNKQTLLASLQKAFDFPDYFGGNWDAAWDLLLDRIDAGKGDEVWRFSIDSASVVNAADLADWLQLMTDAWDYARRRGCPLQIEITGDPAQVFK